MNNDVIKICGPYPDGFNKASINNSDPNFATVKVWDYDDNFVFVNSFIECEHYVSGGWSYIPAQNSEYLLQNQIGLLIALAIITYLFINRRIKLNK